MSESKPLSTALTALSYFNCPEGREAMAELRKQETNPLKPDAHEDRQQLLRAYYARKMDIQNQIAELEAEWGDLMRKIKTVEDRNA